jgi:hypothetical protein
MVIRTCLERGMGEHVAYGTPESHSRGPHFGRAPEHAPGPAREFALGRADLAATRSRQRQERRNTLCPCGSGRKYKNCCARR